MVTRAHTITWLHHPENLRACMCCVWGAGDEANRQCGHPQVAALEYKPGTSRLMRIQVARADFGPCGPEAKFLHISSWGAVRRQMEITTPILGPVVLSNKDKAAGNDK
jgi:hypothetical protein